MTIDQYTFIPAAAESMTERSGKKARVAKHISGLEGNFDDRMYQAFAASLEDGAPYAPIQILGYAQDLMDKVCWNARKLHNSINVPDEVYGCDPTEYVRELVGVSCELEHVRDVVDSDFSQLYVVVTNMLQCYEGFDFELFYFNPSEVVDDEWVAERKCVSYGEAEVHMDEIAEKLSRPDPVAALKAMRERAAA